ncbi:MAG: phosphoribosylglycinamide formyltransferase [Firmicutes bacterium]|nr:phosphoribosylglycinamide formyltransferase [Bacillota bacterium]
MGLLRVAVFVSGNGSNLQALLDNLTGMVEFVLVLANKPDAYALVRAGKAGVPTAVVRYEDYPHRAAFTRAILDLVTEKKVDLICLAGFNRILDPLLIEAFPLRIMNTHPALLPAFGGEGMFGRRVHEAVLASGAKISGATVHFVTAETDRGPIILQAAVPVLDDDTPETLAGRVLAAEHRLYPEAVRLFAAGRLRVEGNRVRIIPG